jgi:aminocarboxymuconate-semialdehyde decarboxylase
MPQTAARTAPRIDMHTHVEVPEVRDLARRIRLRGSGPGKQDWVPAQSRGEHARQTGDITTQLTDPDTRAADMDAMGVDIQVISMNMPTPAYWTNGRLAQQICRAANDGIAAFVRRRPDRFVGIGNVPLQDMDRTLREMDYLAGLGLRGVQIPSNIRTRDLGEAQFRPFWARAEAMGLPVIIHPRGFTHDARLHEYFLWNTIGQPLEEALAMASLIHSGVMDAHPGLKVVISHGGGYLPYYSGRSDRAFSSRPEPRQHIDKPPSRYFPQFYYDSVVFDPDMLSRLVRVAGADRIMMGTDYPRGEVETDPVGFVQAAPGLDDAQRAQIMSGTAMALFGIAPRG